MVVIKEFKKNYWTYFFKNLAVDKGKKLPVNFPVFMVAEIKIQFCVFLTRENLTLATIKTGKLAN
jgi:hypothetical protein